MQFSTLVAVNSAEPNFTRLGSYEFNHRKSKVNFPSLPRCTASLYPSIDPCEDRGELRRGTARGRKMLDTAAVTNKVKDLNEANAKGRTEVGVLVLLS